MEFSHPGSVTQLKWAPVCGDKESNSSIKPRVSIMSCPPVTLSKRSCKKLKMVLSDGRSCWWKCWVDLKTKGKDRNELGRTLRQGCRGVYLQPAGLGQIWIRVQSKKPTAVRGFLQPLSPFPSPSAHWHQHFSSPNLCQSAALWTFVQLASSLLGFTDSDATADMCKYTKPANILANIRSVKCDTCKCTIFIVQVHIVH